VWGITECMIRGSLKGMENAIIAGGIFCFIYGIVDAIRKKRRTYFRIGLVFLIFLLLIEWGRDRYIS
jgi:hypothetical protein